MDVQLQDDPPMLDRAWIWAGNDAHIWMRLAFANALLGRWRR